MASVGGAFGGNRGLTPVPPEKGVFPLDHFHECDETMKVYMTCLRENKFNSEKCRDLSKIYLECRMDKNLMARQDLKELGFSDREMPANGSPVPSPESPATSDRSREKQQGGFVSGIPRAAGSSRNSVANLVRTMVQLPSQEDTASKQKMWPLLSGGAPTTVGMHDAPIKEISWSPELNLLVTGSWDKTLKYWDLRQQNPAHTQQLSERVYGMSVRHPLMVVATADRQIIVYNLANPQTEYRRLPSPLKHQTRCIERGK